MKLGSVTSGLALAAVRQLHHLMSTVTDDDCVKHDLIQVCNIVQRLYRGNAEICRVSQHSPSFNGNGKTVHFITFSNCR